MTLVDEAWKGGYKRERDGEGVLKKKREYKQRKKREGDGM